jgi:hypothetical protein
VELVALGIRPTRWLRFGLVGGAAIGTVGFAAEWGWSHAWGYLAWPSELLPEAFLLGLAAAVAGGVLGGWIGSRLDATSVALPDTRAREASQVGRPGTGRGPALAPLGALLVALAAVGFCIPISADAKVSAHAQLRDASSGAERTVEGTFTFTPRDAAEGAEWLTVTSWQGGGSVVQQLEEVEPGVYRTTEPIPVYGDWKTTLRLHKGTDVLGLPIYMPADEAIPAPEIKATAQFTRDFVRDKKLLQRETKEGVAPWLWTFAYVVVAAIAVVTIAGIARGLSIAARPGERAAAPPYEPGSGPLSYAGTRRGGASRPIARGRGGPRSLT